jgi:hypothetical protein
MKIRHVFVGNIPDELEDKTLYISIDYATAIHKCCCGCGLQVITPLSPNDWKLTFDGESVSLFPSIGNWNFPCQSHYWINHNEVVWSRRWSRDDVRAAREKEGRRRKRFYQRRGAATADSFERD